MAGFVNGVAVRYLDCNDSYFNPGGGHPSDMIPAIMALAEPRHSGGRDVITAIVLAYEVFSPAIGSDGGPRAGVGPGHALGHWRCLRRGQGPGPGRCPHASGDHAGGCAQRSAGRDPRRTSDHVERLCHRKRKPRGRVRRSARRAWHDRAAESFEGKHGFWEQICHEQRSLAAMGGGSEPFRILNTTFKSFPSQIDTQGPIGLAQQLRTRVALEEIASIHIDSYRTAMRNAATEPAKWDPQTRETADHSIPYCVAVAFTDGDISPASFDESRVRDPKLRPLLGKMSVVENPEFTARHPKEFNCRMEVTTVGGQKHVAELRYPLGNASNPLSDTDVEAKLRRFAGAALGEDGCRAVLERCWALDEQEEMGPLLAALNVG